MMVDLHALLDGPWSEGRRPADVYAAHVAAHPREYVGVLLEGLGAKSRRVQGGSAEIVSRLSAEHPELVYPHVELFVRNLAAREPVLRWEAACTLGNLAAVDARGRVAEQVGPLAALLADASIVLQGHAARALAKVARAHPDKAPAVFDALAGAAAYFPGTRVGYVVEAMEAFAGHATLAPRARRFLAPYTASELAPVARKARKARKALGG